MLKEAAMSRPISNEVKVYNIKRPQSNGVVYVYQRTEKYDPETRRMKKAGKDILLGKILPSNPNEIVGTRPRKKKGPAPSPEEGNATFGKGNQYTALSAKRLHVGANRILDRAAELCGIEEDIYALTDKGTAQKLISCARYLVSTGGQRLSQISTWQIMHPIPYAEGLSKDICHRLTGALGMDETFRQSLFQARFRRQPGKGALIVAFNGSTVSTYSENQNEARYGFNKASDGLPTIKWLALYASESCEPLAFAKQPGNVPDVVSVTNALSQISALSDKEIVLVTDNGFYSESNAYELIAQGFSYLMRIELSTKWVRPYLKKHMAELEGSSACCSDDGYVTGITVPVVRTFTKTDAQGKKQSVRKKCYLHFFLDSRKRSAMNAAKNVELQELKSQLESGVPAESLKADAQAKVKRFLSKIDGRDGTTYTFNEDEICRDKESNGIFAVIGYGRQPVVRKTQLAFSAYINREHIEGHFRAEKQTVDGDTVRSWYGDNYMGRMIIQFVALCYEDCLWQRIKAIKQSLWDDINQSKIDNRGKVLAGKKQKLLTWLNSMALQDILSWFDAIEVTEVSSQIKAKRWNTEILERDRMFLQMLGVEINT